jgi:hypothetical protein
VNLALLIALSLPFFFTPNSAPQEGSLPNPRLTPGRVAKSDKDRRGVTAAMEQQVFARYKLPWSRRNEFKIDHLIPIELGGADIIKNLWPQKLAMRPYDAARKKQLTEVLLEQVKAGQITLDQAQKQISRDWIDAYIDHLGMIYLQ